MKVFIILLFLFSTNFLHAKIYIVSKDKGIDYDKINVIKQYFDNNNIQYKLFNINNNDYSSRKYNSKDILFIFGKDAVNKFIQDVNNRSFNLSQNSPNIAIYSHIYTKEMQDFIIINAEKFRNFTIYMINAQWRAIKNNNIKLFRQIIESTKIINETNLLPPRSVILNQKIINDKQNILKNKFIFFLGGENVQNDVYKSVSNDQINFIVNSFNESAKITNNDKIGIILSPNFIKNRTNDSKLTQNEIKQRLSIILSKLRSKKITFYIPDVIFTNVNGIISNHVKINYHQLINMLNAMNLKQNELYASIDLENLFADLDQKINVLNWSKKSEIFEQIFKSDIKKAQQNGIIGDSLTDLIAKDLRKEI